MVTELPFSLLSPVCSHLCFVFVHSDLLTPRLPVEAGGVPHDGGHTPALGGFEPGSLRILRKAPAVTLTKENTATCYGICRI